MELETRRGTRKDGLENAKPEGQAGEDEPVAHVARTGQRGSVCQELAAWRQLTGGLEAEAGTECCWRPWGRESGDLRVCHRDGHE